MPYKYPHPPNLNPHPEPRPDPNIRLNTRPRPRLNALSPTGPGPGFTHIPQPPHSAGLGLQGLRPRIDPSQVPSAVESVEGDREHWGGRGVYTTLPEVGKKPPLASTSEVEFVDQGNSTPNYIRLTTWSFPSTSKLANECGMPLGAIVQPFSDGVDVPGVRFEDSNSYSSHASSSGPPRCSRCRAYINPWCTFTHLKFKCNLCEAETDVPEWYASPLDGQGVRLDAGRREELCRGTIDLILDQAGEEYWGATSRPPKPQRCIFAFDVSAPTFFYAACVALINTLYGDGDGDRGWNGSELAIITYDSTVHLWVWAPDQDTYTTNAHGNANAPRLLVMPDIDEPFIPVPTDALFIDPYSTSGREAVRALLESLPQRFPSPHTGTALGSLLTTAQSMLHDRGGHVVVFLGAIPSVGLGALPARPVNESEDKEKLAYRPRTPFYPNLASECAEQGIGVSLFLGNDEWIDVASVGTLPTLTGGSLFFHPRFNLARDGPVMESQLKEDYLRRDHV
ncbi:vWA-like protein [Gymnopus androsaceus JB14]|uniref:VWA-like protein n=1 Tax=Gymnopus androsaceus JB14 TaxID=1447944 RepID=A0A6A4I775_9AGAR|nr:vWA-like protein [Gymnopus androsaceus JB14]